MDEAVEQELRTQYLAFEVAGTEYGVGLLGLREILQYEPVTPVPSMPRSVRGVINLRGAVVPVVDLAARFGLPATQVTKKTCILIVEARLDGTRTVVGLLADAVHEVIELRPDEVEAPPSFGTRVRAEHLLGLGKTAGKRFLQLLDVERVVAVAEGELEALAGPGAAQAGPGPGAEGAR